MSSTKRFVNLTGHQITVYNNIDPTAPPSIIQASGQVARVQQWIETVYNVNEIPVVCTFYGSVQGLPEPMPGIIYIVSYPCLLGLQAAGIKRSDVVAPDKSKKGRVEKDGMLVGVMAFQVL